MKRTIISGLLLIALISAGLAQDTTTTYIGREGTPESRESAVYMRKLWQEDDGLWQVRQYYLEGGLQMEGTYSDNQIFTREGPFTYYYKDGNKHYSGSYHDDGVVGFWTFWYKDGALMDHGKYLRSATETERDSLKQRQARGEELAPTMNWEGLKDSTWEYFHENGVRSGVEHYLSGKLMDAQYWHEDGSEVAPGVVVSKMPEYPGGLRPLMNYLSSNITYPKKARNKGIQGTVYISFVVNEEGVLESFDIVRSVHPDLDREAMRVVRSMPKWQPALAQNRPVKVQYNLPIRFTLK